MKKFFTIIALLSASILRSQTFVVHFAFNKFVLEAGEKRAIDSFLSAANQKTPGLTINLSGHCDFIGSDSYNNSLSRQRVLTVKKYLESSHDLAGKITSAIGYGKRKPLNDNKTAEDRRVNRRVEIIFIHQPENEPSLIQSIADSATKTGTSITLRNINFIGGRHHPLPESMPVLNELLAAMKTYPRLVIEIDGHICCQQEDMDGLDVETGEFNLSGMRAKAIADWLIQMGIETKRLSYKGFGHSRPIYPFPEKTEEERIANRRVEIKIISK